MITRALGTEPDVDVDTFTTEAEADDIYLLCSDGLTDMVSTREIWPSSRRAAASTTPRGSIRANAGGGEDNIVLFQIAGTAPTRADGPAPVGGRAGGRRVRTRSFALDAVPAVDTPCPAAACRSSRAGRAEGVAHRAPPEPRRRAAPPPGRAARRAGALAIWGLTR